MPNNKTLFLAIAAVVIMAIFGALYSQQPEDGIYLQLYEVRDGRIKPIEPTPDMYLYLKIEAITPDLLEKIAEINAKPAKKIFIPTKKLREIAQRWVSEHERRKNDVTNFQTGLLITISIRRVVNQTVEELYYVVDSVSYRPYLVEKTGKLKIKLHLKKGERTARSEVEYDVSPLDRYTDVRHMQPLNTRTPPTQLFDCVPALIEEVKYVVTPENLSSLPADYFTTYNGRTYIKTPVLIVDNVYSYSGRISASIAIYGQPVRSAAYLTVATGKIIEALSKGYIPAPDIPIWISISTTWGGTYRFNDGASALPNERFWVWIWARPVFRISSVYDGYICPFGYYVKVNYLYDKIETFVQDVLAYNGVIQGGLQRGLPDSRIMDRFFEGGELTLLQIPNSALADGKLDPGESINSSKIFPHFNKCGTDYEVTIPVGAIAALLLCTKLSGGTATPACYAFLSNIGVTLSHQGPTIFVDIKLTNEGAVGGIGYNVPEYVYMAVSKYYYYGSDSCTYKVPVATYFQTR
ncbi:MAG: hypothetical protein ACK4SY_06950 [Pyrobaculum sp.]